MLHILTLVIVALALLTSTGFIASQHFRPSDRLRDLRARATSIAPPAYLDVDRLLTWHRSTFGAAVMVLWTDIIDPATLTDYVRAAQEDYEVSRGNLARWLPNRTIADVVVRFLAGNTGLQEEARFRAYDAEIEIGPRPAEKRITLELPAIGQNLPITEYEQLRARGGAPNVSDAQALVSIQSTAERVVWAISDRMERLRGTVLATGIATINQSNFQAADNFGRSSSHTVTSPSLWSDTTFDRLAYLTTLADLYRDDNGEDPGALLMSQRVWNAFRAGDNMQTVLINGANRLPSLQEVNAMVDAEGLPPIELYNRRVRSGGSTVKALPDNVLLMLPEPVDPNDEAGTQLGATFWGRTLASTEPEWGIAEDDMPGIVAGAWRDDKPPMASEVIGDAIGMPVLANADLSIAATVL